jgi:mRNA-degrading endonuclease toxin of MazEF toxin-antitoxin module
MRSFTTPRPRGLRALDEIARRRGVLASFHPDVDIGGRRTRVMCEMVGAVDARVPGTRVGHLTLDEMRNVDEGRELVLDLG